MTGPHIIDKDNSSVARGGVEGIVSSWPESTESSSWLTREPNRRYSISAETRDAHTAAAKTSPWQSVRTDLTRYSWNDKTETTTSTGRRLISSRQWRRSPISLSLSLLLIRRGVERRDKFLELDSQETTVLIVITTRRMESEKKRLPRLIEPLSLKIVSGARS